MCVCVFFLLLLSLFSVSCGSFNSRIFYEQYRDMNEIKFVNHSAQKEADIWATDWIHIYNIWKLQRNERCVLKPRVHFFIHVSRMYMYNIHGKNGRSDHIPNSRKFKQQRKGNGNKVHILWTRGKRVCAVSVWFLCIVHGWTFYIYSVCFIFFFFLLFKLIHQYSSVYV